MADVNFTGTNTKFGSFSTFKVKGTEGTLAETDFRTDPRNDTVCRLVCESVVEITERGNIVFDLR